MLNIERGMLLKKEQKVPLVCRIVMQICCNEDGVTALEYAMLASLVAVVALAGITLLGGRLGALWQDVATSLQNAM